MTKEQTMKTATHKKWLDELALELRLNDVPGKSIGDALATVEEFLADSGQSPEAAFGTPREYAARLAAEGSRPSRKGMRGTIALSTTSLLAFLVFTAALTPSPNGGQMLISGWQLASMLVLAALVISLPLYLTHLLRHLWALIAVPVVGSAAGVLSAVLTPKSADDAFLALPPAPILLISAALILALSIVGTIIVVRGEPDPVVSPLDSTPARAWKARWFEILTQWLFPIIAALMFGLTAMIKAGS
ncbi:hypothetical protein MB46_18910 [Arthrobacter alpinus]|uniref:hypothetical protein n=1 Tax=Arthrobacter alpinus TaxID=656366 RepID=UPI0006786F59|nr:hypothetical protein [Arthrobacter alpinus]ALV47254.1 hypothetical protein MB46_18910 [Arthrobacter alpinus]